jgi:hypothetical protein
LRRDLGDFQTPPELVAAVLDALGPVGSRWPRVLEPTCGRGHFLAGLLRLAAPPREVVGVELQEGHAGSARALASPATSPRVEVVRANVFDLDLSRDLPWRGRGPLLVVGNPPWVTSAELGVLGSVVAPPKRNVKRLRGLDARTGAANFDVAEAVWLKLLDELADEEPTIAMLCKTSVARSVLQFAERAGLPVRSVSVHRLDAGAWFGASVDACLFRLEVGRGPRLEGVPVFADLRAKEPEAEWGFAGGRPVADLREYRPYAFADGACPLEWRQGLKHDAAAVMELTRDGEGGGLRNKLGEPVDVEEEHVYPLLKGADLARPDPRPRRWVIVTQRRIGQDTGRLRHEAPRLWQYLRAHEAAFAARKSSIYRRQPRFALFGVGPYSFALYKVAVSGLHKATRFRAVGPVGSRPVMFDDTCYFLACASPEQSALVTAVLNDPASLGLIRSLTFPGAKRPITKSLLQRIDLGAVLERADPAGLSARFSRVLESHLAVGELSRCIELGAVQGLMTMSAC